MPDVVAEVTGALQFVPRDFAHVSGIQYGNMSVAFNTVNGAGETRGCIDLHGEKLHDV